MSGQPTVEVRQDFAAASTPRAAVAVGSKRPSMARAALAIALKDARIEWRSRARVNALLFFALSTLLMFSFALGADSVALRKGAGGYLWLSIFFASVLALGESFRVEFENGCLDGLKLVPVDGRAIFLGKALANAAMLLLLALVMFPVAVGLFDIEIRENATLLVPIFVLGCLGIAAPGTVYAALASQARARDVVLPLLLFPIILPSLLASVSATGLVLAGDPLGQRTSWMGLSAAFDVVYWSLGFALFPRLIEDP